MSKRFYVAYGSNLNIRQMKHRCPTAKLYGTGEIKDYELQFKGHPDSALPLLHLKKVLLFLLPFGKYSREMKSLLTVTRDTPPTISSRMFPYSLTVKKSMLWYIL